MPEDPSPLLPFLSRVFYYEQSSSSATMLSESAGGGNKKGRKKRREKEREESGSGHIFLLPPACLRPAEEPPRPARIDLPDPVTLLLLFQPFFRRGKNRQRKRHQRLLLPPPPPSKSSSSSPSGVCCVFIYCSFARGDSYFYGVLSCAPDIKTHCPTNKKKESERNRICPFETIRHENNSFLPFS